MPTLCLGHVDDPPKTAAKRGNLELDGQGRTGQGGQGRIGQDGTDMPLNVTISPGRTGPLA